MRGQCQTNVINFPLQINWGPEVKPAWYRRYTAVNNRPRRRVIRACRSPPSKLKSFPLGMKARQGCGPSAMDYLPQRVTAGLNLLPELPGAVNPTPQVSLGPPVSQVDGSILHLLYLPALAEEQHREGCSFVPGAPEGMQSPKHPSPPPPLSPCPGEPGVAAGTHPGGPPAWGRA